MRKNYFNYLVFVIMVLSVAIISCNSNKNDNTQLQHLTIIDKKPVAQPADTITSESIPLDISPMDISYCPNKYPVLKMMDSNYTAPPVMRLIYSRPHLGGRSLFSNLLEENKPWRLGANESTELDVFKSVTIEGKKINTGRYMLYCIPTKTAWTLVLNKNIDSWGLKIDTTKDIYRFSVPAKMQEKNEEYLTMLFEERNYGADLVIAWEKYLIKLPIDYKK